MKTQFGRSMIEMLGVLAIIGVLSIGGIALYRRAVNNHQANTILDDVNRFAFVVMESNRSFEPYSNIEGLEYTKTSTYFLNDFSEATSQQLAIMVTDVPKGVCEPLIDKASVEYKVRVLPADSVQYPEQVSVYGELYDEQNTDICNNDLNDVVLFFGDTSGQYNPTGEEECTSYADCPHGSFCVFTQPSDTEGTGNGPGECRKIISYEPETKTMSDGNTWTRGKGGLNLWSAIDWCEAQGKKAVRRKDIALGCGEEPCSTPAMQAIYEKWSDTVNYWLNDTYWSGKATLRMVFENSGSRIGSLSTKETYPRAFCRE